MGKLKCTNCKSEKFVRTAIDVVNMFDTGSGIADDVKDTLSISYRCFDCQVGVDEEELAR